MSDSSAQSSSVSPELARIQAAIERQHRVIDDARSKLKELRARERNIKRSEQRERERLAREQEQQEALEFWRKLHESNVRQSDGSSVNAYEFVADKVMPHMSTVESNSSSAGEVRNPDDEL